MPKSSPTRNLVTAAAILLAFFAGYAIGDAGWLSGGSGVGRACRAVTYLVEGTAGNVDLTLETAEGNTEQFSDLALPVSKDVGCFRSGDLYYVSAQNTGETGTVVCRVEIDAVEETRADSSGAFVIATCSGMVP